MDDVLAFCDEKFFTPYVYPETWAEDDIYRQALTLWIITTIGGNILYFAQDLATSFSLISDSCSTRSS